MKGLSAPAIKNKVALRASVTGSIFMDSVRVPHDALLPKSKGLGAPFSCLNSARYVPQPPRDETTSQETAALDMVFHGVLWAPSRTAFTEHANTH